MILSPNGRELTGGAYSANTPEWGFVGTFAPFADPAGGLGADGRQGVWTYTAWAIDLAGNQSADFGAVGDHVRHCGAGDAGARS